MKRVAGVLVMAAAGACGLFSGLDDLNVSDGAVETSTEGGGDGGLTGHPPERPDGGVASANVITFALHTINLGDVGPDGGKSTDEWQTLGYDIDGKVTTASSTDVCLPAQGGTTSQIDGVAGIDDGFGKSILPLFSAVQNGLTSASLTNAIDSGKWTLLFEVSGLSNDETQTAVGLSVQVFEGAALNGPPTFDFATIWPVLSTSVVDGSKLSSGSTLTFPNAYVTGGTFVSGGAANGVLPIRLVTQNIPFVLHVHEPIITFDHVAPDTAASGIIAGVLSTEELVASFEAAAGSFDPSFCSGSTIQSLVNQVQQASDIFSNGTNGPTDTCSGISIGIGFEAVAIASPTSVVQAPAPPPDPCAD